MSTDSTERLYSTRTPHTHTHSCPHCAQVGRQEGRCWSECHGWVSPKKIGTPHYNTGGLSCFYPLPRAWTGWASMQPRDTWLWVESERTDISSWRSPWTALFHTIVSVVSAASAPSPPQAESTRLGHFISTSPLQPSRDKLSFTCWWAQRSPTLYNCTFTQSERTPHAYRLRPVHTLSVMVC